MGGIQFIYTGEMLRQLSVASHAGHMRVLYQRLRWVGMSAAQAARAGEATYGHSLISRLASDVVSARKLASPCAQASCVHG